MTLWGDPKQIGLSLLCSNVVLLFYSGILPCYCCYSHASLAIMLILCSFHNWENTLNLKRDKSPSDWHLSLPALHRHCCHWWSECYCPDAGCHFSKFSQLTLPNLFAAIWQFAHAPCYYSGTMLKCFWLTIYSYIMLSIIKLVQKADVHANSGNGADSYIRLRSECDWAHHNLRSHNILTYAQHSCGLWIRLAKGDVTSNVYGCWHWPV